MTDLKDYVGRPTGASRLTVERGPIARFAESVKDPSAVYADEAAARQAGFEGVPMPPTFAFSGLGHWGARAEQQPEDPAGGRNPMNEILGTLMQSGGIILHGEQEFHYGRPVVAGEVLDRVGRIADVYTKEKGDVTMTFVVTEDTFTDAAGEVVLTTRSNVLHRG